jgi:hypothetical protein
MPAKSEGAAGGWAGGAAAVLSMPAKSEGAGAAGAGGVAGTLVTGDVVAFPSRKAASGAGELLA